MPFYNDILENSDYFKREKKLEGKIEFMSPKEYIEKSAKNREGKGHSYFSEINATYDDLVQKYKKRAEEGSKMPILVLDLARREQEGRHRALVARSLRLDKIPVLVVRSVK